MFKIAASVIACTAILSFVAPAQASALSATTTIDLCDGSKCKGKKGDKVEKPAESVISMCKGTCTGKEKAKDKDKAAK